MQEMPKISDFQVKFFAQIGWLCTWFMIGILCVERVDSIPAVKSWACMMSGLICWMARRMFGTLNLSTG